MKTTTQDGRRLTAGLQRQHLEEGTLNEINIINGGSDFKVMLESSVSALLC